MQLKIKASSLFLLFFYLNIFCKGIGLGNSDFIYKILLSLALFILMIKYVNTYYNKDDIKIFIFLLITGIFSFFITKKPTLMLTCLCLAGIKNVNIEQLFKGMYNIRLLTFLSVIGLSFMGILENKVIKMWRNGNFDIRYSLGFDHPNSLHLAFFSLIVTYLYINFYKMNFFKYTMVLFCNYFIYKFSGSRTGFYTIILLIIIVIIAHSKSYIIKKILCILPQYTFLIMLSASFVLAFLYDKIQFIKFLDRIFNGRIYYSSYFINNYNFSFWGHNLSKEKNLFDNGYLFLYIQFGIVGLLLIGGIIYKICKNIRCSMDVKKGVFVLIFLIYIFTESFSPNIFMNIILLFIAPLLYSNTKIDKKDEKNKLKYLN